jgi:hypothetical protein
VYLFKNNQYVGQDEWEDYYLNQPSAQEAIEQFGLRPWQIWIDSSNPSHSALQKKFPYKEVSYMFALWLITLYFIGLGQYVKSYYSKK